MNPPNYRQQGIDDFKAGKLFSDCPYQGFREVDIEQRWQWQKGWLRAQLDAKDAQNPPDHKV
jgi:ribosome modulation factor